MENEILLKRLTIIKFLYRIGLEQSYNSEMISFFSILSFHDSVEMFLKLAAERKGKQDCQNFMDYWEKIPELTLKENMRNLNTRRVNLKHKGIVPGKIEIESSRVNTTDFFKQNSSIIFGLDFSEISLFNLIKFKKTKEYLVESQNALDKNKIENCIENVTKSFSELIYEYKENKKDLIDKTHFDLTERISFSPISFDRLTRTDESLKDIFRKVDENFQNLENAFEVIALGIDYRKYIKFKILTPMSYRDPQGEYHIELYGEKNWSKENCQFLIDFVLDSALKLQEFDFDYNNLDITEFEMKIISD